MENQKSPGAILLMILCVVVFFHNIAEAGPAIRRAEIAQEKAATVGSEWRDIEAMIQAAQDAAQRGDFALALQLATTAQQQGELGYQQAIQQRHLQFPAYLQ
jgi:hypothetical protein